MIEPKLAQLVASFTIDRRGFKWLSVYTHDDGERAQLCDMVVEIEKREAEERKA